MFIKKLLPLSLFAASLGCGGYSAMPPKTLPLKGKVTMASGSPLKSGVIRLDAIEIGKGTDCQARIQSDGTFTPISFGSEGIQPGKYRVYIDPASMMVYSNGKPAMTSEGSAVPRKFFSPESTTIKVEVTDSSTEVGTIQLR